MYNSIIDYIEMAKEQYGDKVAYIDMNNSVTFREIDMFSKNIAAALISRKLFQKPVLVLAERSVDTPVMFLGVARAGCYYIPIDATQNMERIKQIIDIVGADTLIASGALKSTINKLEYSGEIIILEDIIKLNDKCYNIESVKKRIVSTMPLYVIFTSGSTGKPKGVITSHLSLINYIDSVDEILQLTPEDVLGNQSPLDYIAAIRDIYLPLKTGATTVIIPKNKFAMATELADILDKYKISILCWSSAGLEMCVKIGLFHELTSKHIRKVLFSGAVLPGYVLKVWQQNLSDTQFINQYGPTEATASCTYYIVKEQAEENTILPIGEPYKNYGILLLNEDSSETERGCVGEICISGCGVTLGYYGDRELSAKTFIQNPLNNKYREIIYKTGDLGRFNSEGLLEFCGRKDRQIKHMGHRIELEEIEVNARRIEGVDECVAIYEEEKSLLCLFYSGKAKKKEITLYFRKNLPAFMVPRGIININNIPHLPNGKIDVRKIKEYAKRGI